MESSFGDILLYAFHCWAHHMGELVPVTAAWSDSKPPPRTKSSYFGVGRRKVSIPPAEAVLSCGKKTQRSYGIVFGDTKDSTRQCPEQPELWSSPCFEWGMELHDIPSSLPDFCESMILELDGNYFRARNMWEFPCSLKFRALTVGDFPVP